jgi:hypothetical protein
LYLVGVSALEVAFASALAAAVAAVAAVVSPLSAWFIARGNREHERRLAQDARSYESRATVYRDLLSDGLRQLRAMTYFTSDWRSPTIQLTTSSLLRFSARKRPSHLVAVWQFYVPIWEQVRDGGAQATEEEIAELEQRCGRVHKALGAMSQVARRDLHELD